MALTQNTVGRDRSHSPAAVAELRLNGELPLLADRHFKETLVLQYWLKSVFNYKWSSKAYPSLDYLALADGEAQWLAAFVTGVKLGAVLGESAAVVDFDGISTLRLALGVSLLGDLDLETLTLY